MSHKSERWRADLLLLVAAAIWGVGFLFQKLAMDHVEPLTFLSARSLLATLALAPLAVLEWRRRPSTPVRELLACALLAGPIFVVAGWLQQKGLQTASVTNTGFLTGLYVVFTPLAAWLMMGMKPTRTILISVALSFVGAWLLGGGTLGGFSAGDALVSAGAIAWAAHVVVLWQAGRLDYPVTFTLLQFALVALIGAIGAHAFEEPSLDRLASALWPILYVGFLSTAVTFTLFTYAVRHTPPSEAVVISSTESLFAAAAGAYALGERLSLVAWAGAALILGAILLVQLVPRRTPK